MRAWVDVARWRNCTAILLAQIFSVNFAKFERHWYRRIKGQCKSGQLVPRHQLAHSLEPVEAESENYFAKKCVRKSINSNSRGASEKAREREEETKFARTVIHIKFFLVVSRSYTTRVSNTSTPRRRKNSMLKRHKTTSTHQAFKDIIEKILATRETNKQQSVGELRFINF